MGTLSLIASTSNAAVNATPDMNRGMFNWGCADLPFLTDATYNDLHFPFSYGGHKHLSPQPFNHQGACAPWLAPTHDIKRVPYRFGHVDAIQVSVWCQPKITI